MWVAGMTERQKDAGSFREIYPKRLLRSNMSVVAAGIFCQFMNRHRHRQFFFSGRTSGWTFPEIKKDNGLVILIAARHEHHGCY